MLKHQPDPKFLAPKPHAGLIGHRGLAAVAPENTLASFEAAAQAGLTWVEFDVRLTADDVLVIFHDDELDRTTNGRGFIHETPWRSLKGLDAGSWFHPYFHRETIPVLNKILPRLLEMGLYFNIELKTPPDSNPEHAEKLVFQLTEILKKQWPKGTPLPLISSFNWALLPPAREAFPQIPIGYLTETVPHTLILEIAQRENSALHCDYQALTPELMTQANALGVPVLAYTVNDPEIAQALLEQGVFGIFTDVDQNS